MPTMSDFDGNFSNLYHIDDVMSNSCVITDSFCKSSAHEVRVTTKARQMLDIINRIVAHLMPEIFSPAYTTVVRFLPEYCVQAWSPSQRGDISWINALQYTATRMITGLQYLSCEKTGQIETCFTWTLSSLKTRDYAIQNSEWSCWCSVSSLHDRQTTVVNISGCFSTLSQARRSVVLPLLSVC